MVHESLAAYLRIILIMRLLLHTVLEEPRQPDLHRIPNINEVIITTSMQPKEYPQCFLLVVPLNENSFLSKTGGIFTHVQSCWVAKLWQLLLLAS